MTRKMFCFAALLVAGSINSKSFAQGDPAVIDKIIDEGKNRSQVMKHLEHLSLNIGPRLTGSSRVLEANAWTRDTLASFGCINAHLAKWGDIPVGFDRGPSKVRMLKPVEQDFEFAVRAWSAGTNGPVKGIVVKQPKDMEELKAMGDKLKGVWVLAKPRPRTRFGGGAAGGGGRGQGAGGADRGAPDAPPVPNAEAPAPREGATSPPASQPDVSPSGDRRDREAGPTSRPERQRGGAGGGGGARPDPEEPLIKAMYEAGILGRISASGNELVITSGARGWREMDFKKLPTEVGITIRRSDYDALNSRLSDGEEVVIEADLEHHFQEGPIPVYNTVAEIKGTELPEQVIIVSGHLDSWDGAGSHGTQDNGVGSSTTLETARILCAAGVKPKRTIRFCLWTGEEEGLLGSKGYVKALTDEEKANISAVFVDDGGTNYDGGLQCVANMEPMLIAAVAPINKAFPDMQVKVNVRARMPRGGASDHASFNQENIPGFFWDEVGSGGKESKDYNFIHHTQHDTLRYVVPEYLVQSATCAAVTAYNLAMADTMLPRYEPPVEKEETTTPESSAEFVLSQGPLSGTWEGTINRPGEGGGEALAASGAARPTPTGGDGNPRPTGRGMGAFTLALEMAADGRVRGTSTSRMGDNKLSSVTFDSTTHELKWKIRSEMMGTMSYTAKVDGEIMDGTMTNEDGDFTLNFKATRIENPPVKVEPAAGSPAASAENRPATEKPPAGAGSQ